MPRSSRRVNSARFRNVPPQIHLGTLAGAYRTPESLMLLPLLLGARGWMNAGNEQPNIT
jgi:hypothetical protein